MSPYFRLPLPELPTVLLCLLGQELSLSLPYHSLCLRETFTEFRSQNTTIVYVI